MQSCEIIKRGLQWQVRNGRTIRIWKDDWIKDTNISTPPSFISSVLQDQCVVCDLMNDEGDRWDKHTISTLFEEDIARKIMDIPISTTP